MSRPTLLALVVLVLGTLSIVPVVFSSVLFASATGGTSLYLGLGGLITFALIAAAIATRRFFNKK